MRSLARRVMVAVLVVAPGGAGLLAAPAASAASLTATVTVGTNLNLSSGAGNQFEASVAIDPTDPRRMFVLGRDETGNLISARSSDGGGTWIHARVGTSIANAGLPPAWGNTSVTFDQYGNLFVVYLGSGSTTYTDFAMSTDGGATFTHATALASLTDQPVVAAGGGAVWVTYNRGGANWVQGAAVTGLGQLGAFQPPEPVAGMDGQGFGDITVGPLGQVMVALGPVTGTGGITVNVDPDGLGPAGFGASAVVASTTNVSGFTGVPAAPAWGIDSEAHLAWDHSGGAHHGRVYLAYLDSSVTDGANTDLYVRSSDDSGASWSAPVLVNDDGGNATQMMPGFAIDQTTGALGATWYDTRNDPTRVAVRYYGSVSVGLTWAPSFPVSTGSSSEAGATPPTPIRDTDFGDYTGLAFHAGRLVPVWGDNSNSTGDNPAGAGAAFDLYGAVVGVTLPFAAPVVTTQPVDQSVLVGQVFAVHAAASGDPAPSVQWQASTDGGATFGDIPGATAGTYTATAALLDNGTQLRAVFTNAAGTATTAAARLTVTSTTSITVRASVNPTVFGQATKLTASVRSAVTGTEDVNAGVVDFSDGATLIGRGTVRDGKASITISMLGAGSHPVTATYRGAGAVLAAMSNPILLAVRRASTATALASNRPTANVGVVVRFTATVRTRTPGKGIPTGSVTFSDGAIPMATVTLSAAGRAVFSTGALSVGTHIILATYNGDRNHRVSATFRVQTIT